MSAPVHAIPAPGLLAQALDRKRRACHANAAPELELRHDRLDRAIALLTGHQDALCEAMDADFGGRPQLLSKLTDIVAPVRALRFARRHLRRWMRPQRRRAPFPLGWLGARAWVEYQPKGVVGIISPWNYPVALAFSPLAGALAAGNRVMLKPSEQVPATSALINHLVARYFDPDELSVWQGGPEVGKAFAALPFDHLLFTGSGSVGRSVLAAAAENLTPVTLELGGKSPVVIGSGADLAQAAERIVLGKMMNAGQTCVAPDYVLVRREDRDAFITALRDFTEASWPAVANDPDSTQLISPRAAARLDALVNEARVAGTRVLELQHRGADRRMPLTLVIEPERDQRLLRRELFGPVLPILTWSTIDEAIEHIQSGDHPLGLYHFGSDPRERRELLDRTLSGGVTLDDVFFHVTVEDLPLGGIGASGMGAYHGREGFLTFSHARAIYRQSRLPVARLAGMIPPYGKRLERLLRSELGGR